MTERVHAERGLALQCMPTPPGLAFAGELQDLQQVLGNMRDKTCKWARHEVRVSATTIALAVEKRLQIVIDDNGPGIEADRRDAVMARAAGLNESVPGSGFGPGLVRQRVGLQGGSAQLHAATAGGLRIVQGSG